MLLHVFAYLKKKPKRTLYMNLALPKIDYTLFTTEAEDFQEQYCGAKEEIAKDTPIPRGRSVVTTSFVDASHGANRKTRRSHTGFIIFVNRAPIIWYSKRQQTVETSAFSSEFVAMRVCVEAVQALRFKLRMFGIPIANDGATNIFCDNKSLVTNASNVKSTLNKKHISIAYHYTRFAVAAGIITIAWIASTENLADPLTKKLAEVTRDYFFGNGMY